MTDHSWEGTAEGAEAAVNAANETSPARNTLYAQAWTSARWVALDVPSLGVVDQFDSFDTLREHILREAYEA